MTQPELEKLIEKLIKLPKECEWVEFKLNLKTEDEIGEYISALSNGACLQNKPYGYLVFGIKDEIHTIEGTKFRPKQHKVGNNEFENWLFQKVSPRIDFTIHEFLYNGKLLALFEIPAAKSQPTSFSQDTHIRIGSITRKLRDFPEKERKIWSKRTREFFEKGIALENASVDDILKMLDTECYYHLIKLPIPTNKQTIIQKFISEKLIFDSSLNDCYHISNLGAILFANNLNDFDTVKRKAFRVIQYNGNNKLNTIKDQLGVKGYVSGFEGLIGFIKNLLPDNEEIGKAFRRTVRMYPEIAIRELVANAIIHQDLSETGTNPMIEIFADRIEISNPGLPLISSERFIDECQSRNEDLASLMRRLGICEEKGSGIDKVITNIELFQLPALGIQTQEKHTKVVLYAHQSFSDMDKKDKIKACFQHACLKYVSNQKMTNKTLRERFKIEEKNAAIATRIIKDTLKAGLIKDEDPENTSRKYSGYTPYWA